MLVDPFQKLSEDLGATFRSQREWIERRGLLLIIAHFFTGIGAGTWFFSLAFDFQPGLPMSVVLVGVGGLFHLLFLGRWQRFWRMVTKPQSSWISRGLLGVTLFLVSAVLYLLPTYFPSLPWQAESGLGRFLLILSLLGMVTIFVYKGSVFAVSKAIPFWNNPLLPFLYIVYALRGGIAVLLLSVALMGGAFNIKMLEVVEAWVILSLAVLILFYLGVMRNAGVAAKRSVSELIAGRISLPFYGGTVLLGLMVPLAMGQSGLLASSLSILALIALSSLAGDFYAKFCISKAGIYLPLVGEFPAKAS